MPAFDGSEEDNLWKNTWNWNLAWVSGGGGSCARMTESTPCREAGFGDLILVIQGGRVSAETHSTGQSAPAETQAASTDPPRTRWAGFNFSYRRLQKAKVTLPPVPTPVGAAVPSGSAQHQTLSRNPAVQRPTQQPIGFSRAGFSQQQAAQQPGSALVRAPPAAAPLNSSALPNKPAPGATTAPRATPTVAVPQNKAPAANGAAAHAKPDASKPARDRAPAASQTQRPAENGAKDEHTQTQRKPRGARDAVTPVVAANGLATPAQANGGHSQAAATKDNGEKAQAGETAKAGLPAREPREPREKRPRGGKNKDEKAKTVAAETKTDGADATKAAGAEKTATAGDAEKPEASPSATPKTPVHALYCKGLPAGTTEDDLKGLFAAPIQSTVCIPYSTYMLQPLTFIAYGRSLESRSLRSLPRATPRKPAVTATSSLAQRTPCRRRWPSILMFVCLGGCSVATLTSLPLTDR